MSGHKNKRVPKSEAQLFQDFVEQVDFLCVASEEYDSDHPARMKMASAHLRALFYAGRIGKPVIQQLSVIDENKFFDSTQNIKSLDLYSGPLTVDSSSTDSHVYAYYPLCYTAPDLMRKVTFSDWWSGVIIASHGVGFTREELVRFVANQDGGAHVDESLDEKYSQLLQGYYSLTVSDARSKVVPVMDISLALLRQITHEAITSFMSMHLQLPVNYSNGANSIRNTRRSNAFGGLIDTSFQWL